MHLLDGILNAATCAGTGALAGGAVAWAAREVRADVGNRLVPLLGVMSACVFSAQMVNFPIVGGTSGHLLGGVLAAVVLGPWAGLLAMTVVLVVQCLLFGDGGLTALGANIVNMGLAGSLGGYAVYAMVLRLIARPSGHVVGASVASWVSVQMAAAQCAVELWWSGIYPLEVVLPAMLIVHSFIGVGEALITGAVVAFVLRVRPDLLYASPGADYQPARARSMACAGLVVALAIAFFLSPLASAAPDGLEHVVDRLGPVDSSAAPLGIPLADYQVAGLAGVWLATSLAGVIGVLAVFALAWGLSRGVQARRNDSL
jgi:cobalt/nickel transport system permease protein